MTNNLFDFLRMGKLPNTPPVRHKMRSALLVLGLLLGSMSVWGAEVEFTPSSCTNWGSSQAAQSQEIDGITFSSTSGMKSGTEHLRLYSGATHTFSSTVGNITSIVFTCTASGTNNYGPGKMSGDGYSYSGTVGTWSGNASTVTITGGQSRCTSIVVTYTPSSGTPTCGTPTISPAEGTFYGSQEITITTSTAGASIYYTTDNSTPSSTNGTLYSAPFSIAETTTIKAIAIKAGADDSEVATATYTKGASVTSFNVDFETNTLAAYVNWTFDNIGIHSTQITPHGGEYYGANLNAGGNGVGTASITTSAIFANPGILTFVTSKESTNNNASSWIVQVSEDGTSWTDVETFDATTGGKGTWTEREADLSAYADVYVRIAYSGNTAIRTIDDISLAEASALPKAVKPTFTGDETFLNSTSVSLSTTTEGASIYYTMGDAPADPTASSTLYEGPINVTATTTIKAIAVKTGMDNSPVAEKTFTKATIMTVAEALEAATGNDKYVKGIIASIEEVSTEHGNATYNLKDEGQENSIKIYRGKYLNNANFTAADQIIVGDEVTVFGTVSQYKSVNQFAQGNYIVAIKPAARLSWSADAYTAELGGSNTYPVLTNTNDVTVTYGSSDEAIAKFTDNTDYASLTLVAAGNATITATFAGNGEYKANSASYALTVEETVLRGDITYDVDGGEAIAKALDQTELPNPLPTTTKAGKNFGGWFTDSEKTISAVAGAPVTENITLYAKWLDPYTVAQAKAVIDANPTGTENQYVAGIISQIDSYNSTYHSITYWISADGTTTDQLQVYSGLIGNAATALEKEQFTAKTDLELGDVVVVTGTLKFHNNTTYEFDKNNSIYTFSRKASAGLEYAETAIQKTVGDDLFTNPLTNPNSVTVTYSSSDEDVAVVDENTGEVLVGEEGTATITATFAGNATYKAAEVSYTVTVSAATPVLTNYYEKVTSTAGVVEGTYLIVYEDGSVAFNGGLETLDAVSNTIAVDITNDHKIGVTNATEAATFYIDPAAGTIQAASGKYIGRTANTNGLNASDTEAYTNTISIDGDGNAVIVGSGSTATYLRYNSTTNQARFRYFTANQQPIALYKLANEVVKAAAGLAWSPADDIELTVGEAFTAPTLQNPNSIDAAEITIESSNTDLATIENGVVSLVADATGSATITATFAGNASYKPATVSYKIKINPASSIYVAPSLNVNFGSVEKDATAPAGQTITVTLNNVDAATATLGGANPEAFSITPASPAALTSSGDITISVVSTATVGEFKATLTISDDASAAASKEVKLSFTVTDPASEETAISASTEWVAATEITDGMQVLIVGVDGEDYYAMGEQTNNNRTAVQATMDGEGVLTPGEGTMAFTLVAQGDGTFALRTSNGKYLYAASSGSNYLRSQAELDDNGKWTLTTTSAIAAGSNTRNTMQFNSGSSIFACYGSASQKPIAFYVPAPAPKYSVTYAANGGTGDAPAAVEYEEGETFAVAAADLFTAPAGKEFDKWNDGTNDYAPGATYTVGTADVVLTAQWKDAAPAPTYTEVRNSLEIGRHYTICLDKKVTAIQGATFWSMSERNMAGDMAYLVEETAPFDAGKPYIFKATATTLGVIYEGDAVLTAGTNGALVGTLSYMSGADLAAKGNVYLLISNTLVPLDPSNWLNANRAYVDYNALTAVSEPSHAPGRRVVAMPMHKDVTTGMDELNASETPVKVLINGQLFILRGEKMYNANGQLVK